MAIEDIAKKIIDDARKEADEIIGKAEEEARAKIEEAKKELSKEREEEEKHIKEIAENHRKRIIQNRELEARKELLSVKREYISLVFDKLREKILNIDDESYKRFIIDNLKKLLNGGEKVIFANRDRSRLSIIEGEIKSIASDVSIEYSDEFEAGFVVESGRVRINNTLNAMLKEARDKYEGDVVKMLYGG